MKSSSLSITKKILAKKLNKKFGTSITINSKIIDEIFNFTKKKLIEEKKFNIKNLGLFKIVNKNQRIGRNPKTKEEYLIKKRKTIGFYTSSNFKKLLNNE